MQTKITTQGHKANKEVSIKHQCFYVCIRCTIYCSLKFDAKLSPISNRVAVLKTPCLYQVIKYHYVIPTNIKIIPSTPFYKSYFALKFPDFGTILYRTTLPIETKICGGCSRVAQTQKCLQPPVHECNGRFEASISKRTPDIFSQFGQRDHSNIYEITNQRSQQPRCRYKNVLLVEVYTRTV